MALEELLATNSIGRANDRARSSLDMVDQPRPNRFMIARQIDLGNRFAITGIRPEWLSGLEIITPRTSAFAPLRKRLGGGSSVSGSGTSFSTGDAGVSASTSSAGLSSRRPLNAACRTWPSPVQPANSISATSSGFSQTMSDDFLGHRCL
jgi:hypothetical protein